MTPLRLWTGCVLAAVLNIASTGWALSHDHPGVAVLAGVVAVLLAFCAGLLTDAVVEEMKQ